MITAIFLVLFEGASEPLFIPNSTPFTTMETCKQFAEDLLVAQQAGVEAGTVKEHFAIYRCVDWGSDA